MKRFRSKSILSLIVTVCVIFSAFGTNFCFADESQKYVTLSIEKFTIGQGYFLEPLNVEINDGDTVGMVLARVLGSGNYNNGVDSENISYLENIYDTDTDEAYIPDYIMENLDEVGSNEDSWLGTGDYTSQSGWFYIVNNQSPSVGMDSYSVNDKDVIRIEYSIYGWGSDIGFGWGSSLITPFDGDSLSKEIAYINARVDKDELLADENVKDYYDTALIALEMSNNDQETADYCLELLKKAVNDYDKPQKIENALNTISDEYKNSNKEWSILDMSSFGKLAEIDETCIKSYIANAKQLIQNSATATDIEKSALVLSSIGYDAQNVKISSINTINAIDKIATIEDIGGITGAVFGLLAYDSRNYEVTDKTWTRDTLIDYIKNNQHTDGGFSYSGELSENSDPDLTAMVISALAPYYNNQTNDVAQTVDDAINCISQMQCDDGTYESWNVKNSNSCAMVIIALSSIGIDADLDDRFIKNENSVLDGLVSFITPDNKIGYLDNTLSNALSTEQGFRGLIAYEKFKAENTAYNIYDYSLVEEYNDILETPIISTGSSSGGGGKIELDKNDEDKTSITDKVTEEKEEIKEEVKEETEKETVKFNDIDEKHWAYEFINTLSRNGIINGDENGNFNPDANITRAEFITILAKMSGEDLSEAENNFKDILDTDWYYQYCLWGNVAGITNGTDENTFSPNENITREDMAKMLANFVKHMKLELSEETKGIDFNDNEEISDYAKEDVKLMQKAGILGGNDDGTFKPKNTATRAEASKMLALIYAKLNK